MPGTFFVGSFKREPKGSRYPLTNLNFLVGLHARLLFVLVLSRLNEVIHSNGRLYLVFEWLQKDLKRYMDSANGSLDLKRAKVSEVRFSIFSLHLRNVANNVAWRTAVLLIPGTERIRFLS